MSTKKYLSDVLDLTDFRKGGLNLVTAKTGTGKSTFALNKLPALVADIESAPPSGLDRIIYLIDTIAGRTEIESDTERVQTYDPSWRKLVTNDMVSFEKDKIVVMTYAKFGALAMHFPKLLDGIEMIICDELDQIFWMTQSDKSDFKKNHPGQWYTQAQREKYCCSHAKSVLENLCKEERCFVVALTATPRRIISQFHATIYPIAASEVLEGYKTLQRKTYRSLEAEIMKLERGRPCLVYLPHIEKIKEHEQRLKELGLCVRSIWSANNDKYPMNEEQLATRAYILEHKRLPPDLDVLLYNKAYETCINIFGDIQAIFVGKDDEDTIEQARGRYRNDLDVLYVYSQKDRFIELPAEYVNVRLFVQDRERLAQHLYLLDESGRLCKWHTIKMRLSEMGYSIASGRKNNRRYYIISPPEIEKQAA